VASNAARVTLAYTAFAVACFYGWRAARRFIPVLRPRYGDLAAPTRAQRRWFIALQWATLPPFLFGGWLVATLLGAPIGAIVLVVAWSIFSNSERNLRSRPAHNLRLAALCLALAAIAASTLCVLAIVALDDLDTIADAIAVLLTIGWVLVLVRGAQIALSRRGGSE
jgi:hypothetical protein